MKKYKRMIAIGISLAMTAGLYGCTGKTQDTPQGDSAEETGGSTEAGSQTDSGGKEYIERALNLADNEGQEWTYSKDADA